MIELRTRRGPRIDAVAAAARFEQAFAKDHHTFDCFCVLEDDLFQLLIIGKPGPPKAAYWSVRVVAPTYRALLREVRSLGLSTTNLRQRQFRPPFAAKEAS